MMVVGHNPGLADLARALAGSGQPDGMKLLHARFPTAALAIISFDAAGWADIGAGRGRLEHYIVSAGCAPAAPG